MNEKLGPSPEDMESAEVEKESGPSEEEAETYKEWRQKNLEEQEKYESERDELEKMRFGGEPLSKEGKYLIENVVDQARQFNIQEREKDRLEVYKDILRRLFSGGPRLALPEKGKSAAKAAQEGIDRAGKFMARNREFGLLEGSAEEYLKEHTSVTQEGRKEIKFFEDTRSVFKDILREIRRENLSPEHKNDAIM